MIAIDECHCDLIFGLIVSAKPRDVLELGFGEGKSFETIQRAIAFNRIGRHILVDNWYDWKGIQPEWTKEYLLHRCTSITFDESEFLKSQVPRSYDFILSDGDHLHADKTFEDAWRILRPHGILIYHDVTNSGFPNLFELRGHAEEKSAANILFSKNSRPDEECERGLLVIFKP